MAFYDSAQVVHEKLFTGFLFISYLLIFASFFGQSRGSFEGGRRGG